MRPDEKGGSLFLVDGKKFDRMEDARTEVDGWWEQHSELLDRTVRELTGRKQNE